MKLQIQKNSIIQKRYASKILSLNPGVGEKSQQIAADLIDSGLPAAMCVSLIEIAHATNDIEGRGQGTRLKWFNAAVQRRYGDRIEKASGNIQLFRALLADLETAVETRDTLNGEDWGFSYEQTFLLWELGYDSESILRLLDECLSNGGTRLQARRALIICAGQVKSGQFTQLETALEFYEANRQ